MAAARRPIYRKEKPRSVSKTGLMLCLLLAGGVMLVPMGGDLVQAGKMKMRDLALRSGLIDFNDCVVTSERALACNSRAVGTPLPVALRRIEDSAAEAAAEKQQRQKAESKVRDLALEIEQLSARLKQAELAAGANSFFPSLSGEVRPTGLSVTDSGTGSPTNTGARPQPAQREPEPVMILTPPSEEE